MTTSSNEIERIAESGSVVYRNASAVSVARFLVDVAVAAIQRTHPARVNRRFSTTKLRQAWRRSIEKNVMVRGNSYTTRRQLIDPATRTESCCIYVRVWKHSERKKERKKERKEGRNGEG